MDGGYDDLYKSDPCAWGQVPGSLINGLVLPDCPIEGARVLDVGCGEGKNSIYLARQGAQVEAFDVSEAAIANAMAAWEDAALVGWRCCDVAEWEWTRSRYDLVIAYGLLHCLSSQAEVDDTVRRFQTATIAGGLNVICVFNDRSQDLRPHPDLNPTLLPHSHYCDLYSQWQIGVCTDTDLWETHPHCELRHSHSMTRIVSRKPT